MQLQMLQLLRNFDADSTSVEVLLALSVFAKSLRAEYEANGLEVPQWLTSSIRSLANAVFAKNRDELERQLAAEEARLTTLLSRDERKAQSQARVEQLRQRLGQATGQPVTTP